MKRILKTVSVLAALLPAACATTSVRDKAIDYLALRYASQSGDTILASALLQRGAPVEPLHIDAAGDLTLGVAEANTPLQIAAENGHVEIVRLILKKSPWVDHRCCDSPTALGYAARGGHTDIVRLLLAAGADPTIRSSTGTPVDEARESGHTETERVLSGASR